MTPQGVYHVALADDWDMSLGIGSYEAATRHVAYEPDGYIRATTADGIQEVLDSRYQDLALPLLLISIDSAALTAAGIPVDQVAGTSSVRIRGPLPCTDDSVIVDIVSLRRVGDRWLQPAGFPDI